MGGSNKVAPPPNYAPMAQAMQASAAMSYAQAQQQMAFAEKQFAQNTELAQKQQVSLDQLVADTRAQQAQIEEQTAADRQRYETTFRPLEDSLVRESEQYTPEQIAGRAESAAGRATADVAAQYAAARDAAMDRLESYGIDPSQTRAGALDLSARTQEAGAHVAAANMARDQTTALEQQRGDALRTQALALGQTYVNNVDRNRALGLNFGQSIAGFGTQGLNNALGVTASGAQTMGTPLQWQTSRNQSLGQQADLANTSYKNYLDYTKQRDSQSSGWGQALGLIGGVGLSAIMPGAQVALAPKIASLFAAEGGAVDDVPHQGVSVTPEMSPSNGKAIDDVHALVNAGEFIVPADVVKWKGEEFFQRTIEGARKKKQEAPAKPQAAAVPVGSTPAVSTVPMPPPMPPTVVPAAALPLR